MNFQVLNNTCSMVHMNSVNSTDLYLSKQQLISNLNIDLQINNRSLKQTKIVLYNTNLSKRGEYKRLKAWGFKRISWYKGNEGFVHMFVMNPNKLTWREKLIKFLS